MWNGTAFVRNEYLHLGKRTPGSHVVVHSVSIQGFDASHFSVEKNKVLIEPYQCQRIKVTFTSPESTSGRSFAATIVLKRHGTLDGCKHSNVGDTSERHQASAKPFGQRVPVPNRPLRASLVLHAKPYYAGFLLCKEEAELPNCGSR